MVSESYHSDNLHELCFVTQTVTVWIINIIVLKFPMWREGLLKHKLKKLTKLGNPRVRGFCSRLIKSVLKLRVFSKLPNPYTCFDQGAIGCNLRSFVQCGTIPSLLACSLGTFFFWVLPSFQWNFQKLGRLLPFRCSTCSSATLFVFIHKSSFVFILT